MQTADSVHAPAVLLRRVAAGASLLALIACLAVPGRWEFSGPSASHTIELVPVVMSLCSSTILDSSNVFLQARYAEEKGAEAELSSYSNVLSFGPISDPKEPVYTSSLFSPFEVVLY